MRPHLSFSYRFRPSTLQHYIRLKILLYTQCACSNELDGCAFQYISAREIGAILDSLLASVCHFGYAGRVVWRPVVSILMTPPFSNSIVFSVHTSKRRFQKASFFSNGSVFGCRFRFCSMDDSRIRSKRAPFSFENGLVWTGPKW